MKHESARGIEGELRFGTRFNRLAGITLGGDISFSSRLDSIVQRDFTTQCYPLACFRDLNVTSRITPPSRVYIARLPSGHVIRFSCGAHYFSWARRSHNIGGFANIAVRLKGTISKLKCSLISAHVSATFYTRCIRATVCN